MMRGRNGIGTWGWTMAGVLLLAACASSSSRRGGSGDGGGEPDATASDAGPGDGGEIGACAADPTLCAPGLCMDTASGHACTCPEGYEDAGGSCVDVDECAGPTNPCDPGVCTNEEGSYTCDGCPSDPAKTEPGICGCGVPDADMDSDGTLDCNDGCPTDPAKTEPGVCGCGVADTGAGTPMTTTIGEPLTNDWTESNHFRGNVYYADANTTLTSFEQHLGLASSCTLDFYVVSGASETGPWTPVWSTTRSEAPRTGYFASGTIGASISAGTYYGLGVAWSCSGVTYYGNDGGGWPGFDAGVGLFRQNFWDNAYPGYGASYTPPNSGTASLAYAQRVTVGGSCP